jgi:NADH:ubiquinone oxidoreductase subunit D
MMFTEGQSGMWSYVFGCKGTHDGTRVMLSTERLLKIKFQIYSEPQFLRFIVHSLHRIVAYILVTGNWFCIYKNNSFHYNFLLLSVLTHITGEI